jgi:hypothetical protein
MPLHFFITQSLQMHVRQRALRLDLQKKILLSHTQNNLERLPSQKKPWKDSASTPPQLCLRRFLLAPD